MSRDRNTPRRRFKEFQNADGWTKCKLNDICKKITDGAHNSPKEFKDGYYMPSVKDMKPNGFDFSDCKQISLKDFEKLKSQGCMPEVGDVLVSKDGSILSCCFAVKEKVNYVLLSSIAIIRPNNEMDSEFLAQYFKRDNFKSLTINEYSKGNALKRIVLKDFQNISLQISKDREEQKEIGLYFSKLDNLITLNQRKLEKLKALKKAYLTQMFPDKGKSKPKLRFAGFDDEWEEYKLSDISQIIGGGTPSTSNSEYWDGDINWYSPVEIGDKVYAYESKRKITSLGLEKSSAKILPADRTLLFSSRAGIGAMAILKAPAATNQGFQSIVLNNGYDIYFLYSMGSTIKSYAEKVASGSTFLEISGKQLGNMNILVPSSDEQRKIGELFKSIDNLIALQQQKIEKLQNLKKAYLNEMFI